MCRNVLGYNENMCYLLCVSYNYHTTQQKNEGGTEVMKMRHMWRYNWSSLLGWGLVPLSIFMILKVPGKVASNMTHLGVFSKMYNNRHNSLAFVILNFKPSLQTDGDIHILSWSYVDMVGQLSLLRV